MSKRIHPPQANTTAIKAIRPDRRRDGMLVLDDSTGVVWRFDAQSSASAADDVLVPDEGGGRYLASKTVDGTEAIAAAAAAQADATQALADAATAQAAAEAAQETADASVSMQAVDATLVAGTVTINSGIVVATNSEVDAWPTGAITGSTNFACVRELKASRVNGADGVGTVVIQALGNDGALDSDAAGAIRVRILTPQA